MKGPRKRSEEYSLKRHKNDIEEDKSLTLDTLLVTSSGRLLAECQQSVFPSRIGYLLTHDRLSSSLD